MTTEKAGPTPSTSMSGNPVARPLGCACLLILTGCTHYADFTLPPLDANPPAPLTLTLQPAPVLSPGAPGQWDSSDVLNPSVVFHDQQFWNFYSGFDGEIWHTGVATSADGIKWTRRGVVLSPDPNGWDRGYIAANGSALWRNGEFLCWYEAGEHEGVKRIGLARSSDGLHFRKEAKAVLDVGPYRSWDERAVADPYVFETGGWLYMYYLGQDRAARQRIGVARSRDGLSWRSCAPIRSSTSRSPAAARPTIWAWTSAAPANPPYSSGKDTTGC